MLAERVSTTRATQGVAAPVRCRDTTRRQVRRRWMPVGCATGAARCDAGARRLRVRVPAERPAKVRSAEPDAKRGRRERRRREAARRDASGSGHGAKRGRSRSSPRRGPAPGGRGASHQAAMFMTGIPSWRALSSEVAGDAGAGERDDAGGQEVEELVVAAEGGCLAVCVPVRAADDLVDAACLGPACRDLPRCRGRRPWSSTMSSCFARVRSRVVHTMSASGTSLPPVTATRVPSGRWACVSRSLPCAAEVAGVDGGNVSCPVWLVCEPWRGRQRSPVSAR